MSEQAQSEATVVAERLREVSHSAIATELLKECEYALERLLVIERTKGVHSYETISQLQAVIEKAREAGL